ncbi:hypothetical protein LNQ03_32180 [Klebsiella pneumoniae subsp. pneumoniae]|nr:hypothetical protein [Klebsiella pneumoniae subsp. pneumoniae]
MQSLASWNDAENITYRVVPTLAQRGTARVEEAKSRQEGVEHRRTVAPVGTHATATRAASGKGAFPFRSGDRFAITWRAGQRGIRTGP